MNAEGGAGVEAEMIGGQEEGVGECVVAGANAEFQVAALEAHADIVLWAIPCPEIGRERIRQGVLGVRIAGVLDGKTPPGP